jgi:hypothetical protein
MILTRITPIIMAGDVLQDNYYAFLPGRSTNNELIQLINVLEEVVEHRLHADLNTSDVAGAFDSSERQLSMLSGDEWASWCCLALSPPTK